MLETKASSAPLEGIVRRCLPKQPTGRYQKASQLKAALKKILRNIG
jgi:hypothetical protein